MTSSFNKLSDIEKYKVSLIYEKAVSGILQIYEDKEIPEDMKKYLPDGEIGKQYVRKI